MIVCSLVEIYHFTANHCLHLYCEDWGKGLIHNVGIFLSHYEVSNHRRRQSSQRHCHENFKFHETV